MLNFLCYIDLIEYAEICQSYSFIKRVLVSDNIFSHTFPYKVVLYFCYRIFILRFYTTWIHLTICSLKKNPLSNLTVFTSFAPTGFSTSLIGRHTQSFVFKNHNPTSSHLTNTTTIGRLNSVWIDIYRRPPHSNNINFDNMCPPHVDKLQLRY